MFAVFNYLPAGHPGGVLQSFVDCNVESCSKPLEIMYDLMDVWILDVRIAVGWVA